MAGEMIANVQNGASIMSVVSSAKGESEGTGEFAQVLGECSEAAAADGAEQSKDEQLSDAAVLMAAYMPFAGYGMSEPDTAVGETDAELSAVIDENIGEIAPTQTAVQTPSDVQIGVDAPINAPNPEPTVDTAAVPEEKDTVFVGEDNGESEKTEFNVQTGEYDNSIEPNMQVQPSSDEVQKVARLITDSGIQLKEVESVKYVTFNPPVQSVGKEKIIGKMESLIQNMFFGEEQIDEDEEDEDKIIVTDKTVTAEQTYAEAEVGVTAQNTAVEGESELDAVDAADEVQNIEFEINTEPEKQTSSEQEFSADGDGAEKDSRRDNLSAKVQNTAAQIKPHDAFVGVQNQNRVQTHSFKLYNTDTNISTSQQLGRIMTAALKTDGFISTTQQSKEMVLQLQPETLGKIIIKLQSVEDELNVKITATNEQVRQMLSSRLAQMGETIKEQGVNLANMQLEQSALHNNREQGGGTYNGNRQNQSDNKKDDEKTDYKAVMEDIEAALASIEIIA